MPGTTTEDIITQDEVRAILEERQEHTYQFRRAFRDHDATGINSGSFRFPTPDDDFDGDMVEVAEGSEYPRNGLSYGDVEAVYTKYGFEFPFTDEAVDDAVFDLQADGMAQMMVEEERRMDAIAYGVLDGNHGETIDSDGVLDTDNVIDARRALFQDGYDMSSYEVYVGPDGMHTILEELGERATDLGDAVHQSGDLGGDMGNNGLLGTYAGLPVYATNTGHLGEGEAFVVDASAYGYESRRWDTETEVYRSDETDETIAKVRNRLDFVATDPDAAVKIENSA